MSSFVTRHTRAQLTTENVVFDKVLLLLVLFVQMEMVAWHGIAAIFHCRQFFLVFRVFRFSFLLYCCFAVLILTHSLSPSLHRHIFFFSFAVYLPSYGLIPKHKTESPDTRVYLYVCIMCWIAQSSRLFSCVVYAVFLCTFMLLPSLLLLLLLLPLLLLPMLLPFHGQTFTINFQSYAFILLLLLIPPFVCFFLPYFFSAAFASATVFSHS